MPSRKGLKKNVFEKRNKSVKMASAVLATTAVQDAYKQFEVLQGAIQYSDTRIRKLKTQRALLIMIVGLLLITLGVTNV
jgi:hypothetical protein